MLKQTHILGAILLWAIFHGTGAMADFRNHSYSNPDRAIVTRFDAKWRADFSENKIRGEITYRVKRLDADVSEIVLDVRDLKILRVTDTKTDTPLSYSVGESHPVFGAALTISLPKDGNQISILYETDPAAAALQWFTPEQTLSKQPMLYSLSFAILARSWMPCQDRPDVRTPFNASWEVPQNLLPLMTAENNPRQLNRTGEYRFVNSYPIPAYLIGFAIGHFRFRKLDDRSGIYAEPPMITAAVTDFQSVPTMLAAAEKVMGRYPWMRSDSLFLPTNFPYGGMEYPMLTFFSSSLITGDGSLDVWAAHELSHGWFGNSVTNFEWNDFWLNEGFAVYLEQRLLEKLKGPGFANLYRAVSLRVLERTIKELQSTGKGALTRLVMDTQQVDPASAVTEVPYQKGALFLRRLEELVDDRPRFDAFLRGYASNNAFQSMTTPRFIERLLQSFPEIETQTNLDEWLHGEGLPSDLPYTDDSALDVIARIAERWSRGEIPSRELEFQDWNVWERVLFLEELQEHKEYPGEDALRELEAQFSFYTAPNPELLTPWFLTVIRRNYQPAFGELEKYLSKVARPRNIRPLYEALMARKRHIDFAKRVFATSSDFYHPTWRTQCAEIISRDRER